METIIINFLGKHVHVKYGELAIKATPVPFGKQLAKRGLKVRHDWCISILGPLSFDPSK
jgi:hypothetical protein